MGRRVVIHGDAVLTNILINQFDKIKFIDMRGQLGGHKSITGDWLYDWGKLYQSLYGYDEIVMDRPISSQYKNGMLDCFEKVFVENHGKDAFKRMKMVTSMLLFSLIPLHHNNKCCRYYELAVKLLNSE